MNLLKLVLLSIISMGLFAAQNSLETVKLQLQWKNQFEFAGYYAAKEKGFYKDVGLNVEFLELNKGEDIVQQVLKGKAQYGLAYSSIVAEYMNGKPIVLVANFFKQSPLVLIAQKDIKIPSDLKGKRVMGVTDSIHNMTLLTMLSKFDVKTSDLIDVPANFKLDAFINKKVDAMSVFTTNEIYTLGKKGIAYNVFDPVMFGTKYYDQNLFTSKKELLEHPNRAEKLKKASIRGWKYALSHKEEIIDLILKKYNTQHKSKEALRFEAKQIEQIMLPKLYPIGSIDPQRIRMIADNFTQAGFIKADTKRDLKKFIFDYGESSFVNDKEEAYYEKKKVIKMCIDPDWMPFEAFDKEGNYIGMTADFFKLFEKDIKIPIQVVHTKTWEESLDDAKKRKCDILSLAMETSNRKKYLNFTTSYLDIPLVIATKLNVTYIDSFSLLKDKKVGIVKGYAFAEILKKRYPWINIVEVKNVDEGLQQVVDGKLFGFIGTISTIGYKFQTKFTGELKISGKFDEKWSLGVGVRNDDEMLFNIMQKAVENLSQKQKQEIINRHIAISYQKGFDYSLFWKFFAFVIFVILIFIYRHYTIRKLNTELEDKFQKELERSREKDRVIYHQRKLISMGEMIENIAHQWRQPLSQVNSAVFVIDSQLYKHSIKDKTIEQKLSEIEELTKYMSKTIDDFKDFFNVEKKKEKFLLNALVRKSINIIEPVLNTHNIDVITIFEDAIVCEGYPNELQQVLAVILNNAKDVLTDRKDLNPSIKVELRQSREYNHISICDNGGGIKEDIKEKIFEPYFTTKHKSQGTGVGLYMAKVITEDSLNGELKVSNTKNGACFEIMLRREDKEDE